MKNIKCRTCNQSTAKANARRFATADKTVIFWVCNECSGLEPLTAATKPTAHTPAAAPKRRAASAATIAWYRARSYEYALQVQQHVNATQRGARA